MSDEQCPECGSDDLFYEGKIDSTVRLRYKSHVPRQTRTGWFVACNACGNDLPPDQQRGIEAKLFQVSEAGESAERTRCAAPQLLEACKEAVQMLRMSFAPHAMGCGCASCELYPKLKAAIAATE